MSPVNIDRTNKPQISRGQGSTGSVQVPGTPGPPGPGGSDAGTAGYVNDTSPSQTRAALNGAFTQRANNLSDLPSAATARTNLGLGTAAVANVPAAGDAAAGEVVKGSDTRMTNARTPTAHKASHATGGTDELTPADIGAVPVSGPWAAYTPSWTSSGTAPSIGNGTIVGRFLQEGKRVNFTVEITFGSTTAAGTGVYTFSLPTTMRGGIPLPVGMCVVRDVSANVQTSGACFAIGAAGSSSVAALDSTGARVSATTYTYATGDIIALSGTYEAA